MKNRLRNIKKLLPATPPADYYKTCGTLPLPRFIRVMVDRDYSQLIIKGAPAEKDLITAWRQISFEYLVILDIPEVNYQVELQASMRVLEVKLVLTDFILTTLSILPERRLTDILVQLGFDDLAFDPMDPLTYHRNLQAVKERAGGWEIELQQKEAELQELESKTPDGKAFNDDYFDDILMALSKAQGYHIKPIDLTTSQFAVLVKRQRQKADQARYEEHLKNQMT